MLKDNIINNVHIITNKRKNPLDSFFQLHGKLEVWAYKNGRLIHYDNGENTVMLWAKHSTMHLLTGESFTSWGETGTPRPNQRYTDTDDGAAHTYTSPGVGVNKDGTLLSGQQYFAANSSVSPAYSEDWWWSISNANAELTEGDISDTDSEMKYPFFPTKMLFGTGFEFDAWSSVPTDYQTQYTADGYTSSHWANVSDTSNLYSNEYTTGALVQKKTMNDIYSGSLTTPVITDTDFAISGAIKNGDYTDGTGTQRGSVGSPGTKTYYEGSYEYLIKDWAGIGDPSFIYATRVLRNHATGAEVSLSADSNVENKITYTIVMPEQTTNGEFYPYNGYTLKEAGLCCDARLILGNSVPTTGTELEIYEKMPYGILFAKRYIAPIAKTHDVSITAQWTIYL